MKEIKKQKRGKESWRSGNFNILISKDFTDQGAFEQTLERGEGASH